MRRAWSAAPYAAVTILALALGLHRLGGKGLIQDESISVEHARLPLSGLWDVVTRFDPNMGLYYVLLHVWVALFGDSEAAARSLSVIAAALAVPVVVLLGRRLFGLRAGLAAGLLLALNAFFVHYAQTARSYSMLVLLVSLSSYYLVAELQEPSRGHRIGYVLATAVGVYVHYMIAYVVLVQLLTLVAVRRRQVLRAEWVMAALALAVLCIPALIFARRKGNEGISWIDRPTWGNVTDLPLQFTGGGVRLAQALLALCCLAQLLSLRDRERWPAGFVGAWLVLPVILVFATSFDQPLFLPYYLIIVLPPLFLLVGAAVARLPGRALPAIALAFLVVASARALHVWYDGPSGEDYRGAARYVLDRMRPSDALVFYPDFAQTPVDYYWRRAGSAGPALIEIAPGESPAARPPRIWVLIRDSDASPENRRALGRGLGAAAYREVAATTRFHKVGLSLYVLSPARPRPG